MFPTPGLNIMPENDKNSTKHAEKIQNNRFPVEFQTLYRDTFFVGIGVLHVSNIILYMYVKHSTRVTLLKFYRWRY